MARRVDVTTIDDIDGKTEGAQKVTFALNGVTYEIDLAEKNREKLATALAPFIEAGSKVSSVHTTGSTRRKSAGKTASTATGPTASEVREWALANGYEIPARGRISAEIQEAYAAAN